MGRLRQCWAVLCFSVFLAGISRNDAGTFPSLDDLSNIENFSEGDLVSEIARLADLPLFAQKGLLRMLGAGLMGLDGLPCNLFGGSASCQDIPPDSRLAKECPNVNTRVDCAFRGEALRQAAADPDKALRQRMAAIGHKPCESCYSSLQQFWCGQAVPKCGTFDKIIDKILPVLSSIARDDDEDDDNDDGKRHGKDPEDALAEIVPDILRALSMGLPCREMCDAVTQTCGCGDPETFGEVLTSVHEEADVTSRAADMSFDTAQKLFRGVWDVPICDLFARENTPGFHGVCDVPPGPQPACDWCTAKRPQVQLVWQQMVAQVSQSVSSMMGAGLDRVLTPGAQKSNRHGNPGENQRGFSGVREQSAEVSGDRNFASAAKKGSHAWLWVMLPCTMVLLAGLGYAGYYVYQKRYNFGAKYVDLGDVGADEEYDYSPPNL